MPRFLASLAITSTIGGIASLSAQAPAPSPGFTFVDPSNTADAFLLDSASQVVHTWTFGSAPGLASYLTADGTVLRTYRNGSTGPGVGGAVQRVALDSSVLWDYTPAGPGRQHHDIQEMPNGNVLILMTDPLTSAQMVALGRDPAHTTATWTSERIIEVQPTGPTSGVVVWEWRAIDHLVQDFDASAPNFDTVSARPERIDANYPVQPLSSLWMHMNSIDYNESLDQVVVSCRNWDELWVIDHSTTTAEAAGSTGGNSGRGGDLLYRWGNPAAYGTAGTQHLLGQHDVHWIPAGRPGAGNLICFNNRRGTLLGLGDVSSIVEVAPPVDALGNYASTPGTAFGPPAPTWEYLPTGADVFHSNVQSSAERLPNGHTLINSVGNLKVFEIDTGNQVIWQATIPVTFKTRRLERSLWSDTTTFSSVAGGTVHLDLLAGTPNAGNPYFLSGSMSGTSPGIDFAGWNIPLNPDLYLVTAMGSPLLPGSIGLLDANGRATASFVAAPGAAVPLIGTLLHHSFLVLDASTLAVTHVGNAQPLLLAP